MSPGGIVALTIGALAGFVIGMLAFGHGLVFVPEAIATAASGGMVGWLVIPRRRNLRRTAEQDQRR